MVKCFVFAWEKQLVSREFFHYLHKKGTVVNYQIVFDIVSEKFGT